MLCRSFLILSVLISNLFNSFAQSRSVNESEVWPQYYLDLPIKDKWVVKSDFSHRYKEFFENKTQWIGRVAAGYKFKEKYTVAVGYAYSEFFLASGKRLEHRPFQQIEREDLFTGLRIGQRLRLEERFQKDRIVQKFNYRLRYQINATIPLLAKPRLSLSVSDELMLNAGKQVSGNKFDQNRAQIGLQLKLAEHLFITPAYLYLYQWQASKKDFRNVDVVRTLLIYR